MDLKLRHLAVFHAVMNEGSISKAADRLMLTQPAVSMALTKLEEMLGYRLFIRSKGYFAPRPEAKQLQADAELAIMAFERFASHAELIGKGAQGLVRVGAIGSPAHDLMPELMVQFAALREKVEIQLQVQSSAEIAYLVANGQVDIGIVEAPVAAQSVEAVEIAVPCVCLLRETDPLAEEAVLSPRKLTGRRLLTVRDNHTVDRQVRAAFLRDGVPWHSQMRGYFFAIMRNMVARGAGVAVVDAINGLAKLGDGVVWRPFEPAINYQLAVIRRSDSVFLLPAREFMEMTIDRLREFGDLPRG